ncbi:MAG TPA: bacillithiol biosynthesis cysteine-adding enzyme BshC [Pyrinomonadaceae bacterium]|nr:bacillithiol biosynthesis cysteine-adding enzyme BshC [Pyrinomonadaceae bacterium]
MSQDSESPYPSKILPFKVESLPFSEIPGQSKLFIEYQKDSQELAKYYPSKVSSHTQIARRIPEVLANYKTDRNALCDALEDLNRACGAGEKTLENINLLRDKECVAVVSGQQAGLLTGPLYTIYKALSAVQLSECLRGRGVKAVPVFWIASEDHDFEEVSKAFVIGSKNDLIELENEPENYRENLSVGYVKLDHSIKQTIDNLFENLPRTEFTEELRNLIEESWQPGFDYGEAFGRLLISLLGKYGLILLFPLDERLKKLAAPIYVESVKKSQEIVSALQKRSRELEENGFHAQVLVSDDYFPLFWQAEDNTRHALKQTAAGTYRVGDLRKEFSLDELAEIAAQEPQRFSPGVALRAVVQDYLLPTVCYFGGGAEVAYFAQSSEVYRILQRPVTPILHRQSFTIVEPKQAKILDKFNLEIKDLFDGIEYITPRIVEDFLNPEMKKLFAEVEENINTQLNRLDRSLAEIEPTLADNLANKRRKIIYHIANLRKKYHFAEMRKDKILTRQIEMIFNTLVPNKHLQERTLNVTWLINRYGLNLIDWIYQAIDLDDKEHRVIYL